MARILDSQPNENFLTLLTPYGPKRIDCFGLLRAIEFCDFEHLSEDQQRKFCEAIVEYNADGVKAKEESTGIVTVWNLKNLPWVYNDLLQKPLTAGEGIRIDRDIDNHDVISLNDGELTKINVSNLIEVDGKLIATITVKDKEHLSGIDYDIKIPTIDEIIESTLDDTIPTTKAIRNFVGNSVVEEKTRAINAEELILSNIDNEVLRATEAEEEIKNKIDSLDTTVIIAEKDDTTSGLKETIAIHDVKQEDGLITQDSNSISFDIGKGTLTLKAGDVADTFNANADTDKIIEIPIASNTMFGIVKIDEDTLKKDADDKLYADIDLTEYYTKTETDDVIEDYVGTGNLNIDIDGASIGTFNANANTDIIIDIPKTSDTTFGVSKVDNNTIISNSGILLVVNSIDTPTSADINKVLTVTGDGTFDWEESSDGTVTDVQIDGTSIVDTDGVANIPIATTSNSGVVTSTDIYDFTKHKQDVVVNPLNGKMYTTQPAVIVDNTWTAAQINAEVEAGRVVYKKSTISEPGSDMEVLLPLKINMGGAVIMFNDLVSNHMVADICAGSDWSHTDTPFIDDYVPSTEGEPMPSNERVFSASRAYELYKNSLAAISYKQDNIPKDGIYAGKMLTVSSGGGSLEWTDIDVGEGKLNLQLGSEPLIDTGFNANSEDDKTIVIPNVENKDYIDADNTSSGVVKAGYGIKAENGVLSVHEILGGTVAPDSSIGKVGDIYCLYIS